MKPTSYETPAQKGLRLEPIAREKYCAQAGTAAEPVVLENSREGEEFMAASLDGFVPGQRVIEIKCPDDARTHLDAREGQIPEAYWAQCQHNMHVAEVLECAYISYYEPAGDQALIVLPVQYDSVFIREELLPAEKEFWKCVQNDTPPVPNEQISIDLEKDAPTQELVKEFLKFRRMREEAQQKEYEFLARIKFKMRMAGTATASGALFRWQHKVGTIHYKDLPEVKALLKSRIDLSSFRGPDVWSLRVERK